ncbi:lactate racemase domain-containing protein [Stieleria varia]|uniref:LarA-like N-terminal domain-containing protein n=1 Tax=Stieleria varia TaxID=2528005 RepID=A0A5C6AF48_9BACT|nr:lactate racemase domain-containing protein [Stieleria varia]TWT98652.1 hypothetical protein Pla52n_51690 [Stieleria varia]
MLFSSDVPNLASDAVWEYESGSDAELSDVIDEVVKSLNAPLDFPGIDAAIVPGDRVAIALDPNVPQIGEVVSGLLRALHQSDIGDVDIVLWDEATEQTVQEVRSVAGECAVIVHQSRRRGQLRYLGADGDAEPIYLNRAVIDADFVLPVHAIRADDVELKRDLTGIFPSLADSATVSRFLNADRGFDQPLAVGKMSAETRWLLGVQLVLGVTANAKGLVGNVFAGTPDAIGGQVTSRVNEPDSVPPKAELVVASLDGESRQQTWANAIRAAHAALRFVADGGTIVIWTDIEEPPTGRLTRVDSDMDESESAMQAEESDDDEDDTEAKDGFPPSHQNNAWARVLQRIMQEHRVLVRTRLDPTVLESMGVGVIQSPAELEKLSQSFPTCGVLRAAQFAGASYPGAAVAD